MTQNKPKDLSGTEWKVMKAAWELDEASAREISNLAAEKFDMTHQTVKVLLFRLVEKGHLKTRPVGNSYLYIPVSSMEESLIKATNELLEETSAKAADSVMLHLIQDGKLSAEGLKNLRKLLDEKEE